MRKSEKISFPENNREAFVFWKNLVHSVWNRSTGKSANGNGHWQIFLINCKLGRSLFWFRVNWVARLTDRKLIFRMEIILGTIPSWLLVFCVCIPGWSRNGSGECPYLGFQEKLVKFRQSTQNAGLCFSKTLHSISWEFCITFSSMILGTDVLRDWPFLSCFSCVSLDKAANYLLFLNVAIF